MSGNHSVSNQADREEGLDEQPKVKWGFAAAVVIALVLLAILAGFAMFSGAPHHPASDGSTPTQVVQTAPAQPELVVCEPSSTEVRHCTFGTAGTAGFGTIADGHVCLDQSYGPNQTYRFQYWDTDHAQWQDFDAQHDPATFSTVRFIANPGINSVTVGYWKSETACAANDASQSESSDATSDEPVEINHVVP